MEKEVEGQKDKQKLIKLEKDVKNSLITTKSNLPVSAKSGSKALINLQRKL